MTIAEFKTDGLIRVSYPAALKRAVLSTVDSWQAFCALPKDIKKCLPYSNTSAGVGYETKDGTGTKGDNKENFDIALSGKQWLLENVAKVDNQAVLEFVMDGLSLASKIKPFIVEFARRVETEFGIEGFVEEVSNGDDVFFVRFIHNFEGGKIGEEITVAHVDQSGFTPELFVSDPGLEYLAYNGVWLPMDTEEGETTIIPSMQMQLRSKGQIKATCHRVIANEVTAKQGRYSAVCFVQLKNTPKYNKTKFGRLQEKKPGFNYDMPHEEFSKYFTKV